MYTLFEELNFFLYDTARCAVYDGVIWCLGPLVDDSREYGLLRLYLAAGTCSLCRRLLRISE